jgi:KipI family sensor histidine kinase inhibitor
LLSYGRRGLLVDLDSLDEALRLSIDLDRCRPIGVTELTPGARTVLVQFDPAQTSETVLRYELAERAEVFRRTDFSDQSKTGDAALTARTDPIQPGPAIGNAGSTGETVEIPVIYDGPDLDEVARLTGLSVAELVEHHRSAEYRVAFTGFAPGFGYLSGGDPALAVPRRDTPRTKVAAGAVGLAGEFTGVYPRPGPGGWQIIGHTDTPMWDLQRTPAALLRPGVRVRFRAATP